MPLKARVGRHTQDKGRQCQNYPQDQQTVIDLLNRIPVPNGGAGGGLKEHIVSGKCSDALYRAISQFEDKYCHGQRHGFVDPGGPMLKRMEELAGGAEKKAAAQSSLGVLRANVLNVDARLKGFWHTGHRVEMDRLVAMAIKHIDALIKNNQDKLPFWAQLFGKAYVGKVETEFVRRRRIADINYRAGTPVPTYEALNRQGETHRILIETKFGKALTWLDEISTGNLPALILFADGVCAPVAPYVQTPVAVEHDSAEQGYTDADD
jgi:hypothetical protein